MSSQLNEWRKIPNFSDYSASLEGFIRNDTTYRILKPQRSSAGYHAVTLKGKSWFVHRLVCSSFLGDANGRCVNHIDGNKTNNCLENLEYTSYSGNNLHAYRSGLKTRTCAKLTENQVREIKSSNEKGSKLAIKYNISRAQIYSIRNARAWVGVV